MKPVNPSAGGTQLRTATSNSAKRLATRGLATLCLVLASTALSLSADAQSITVPAQFVYTSNYGPEGVGKRTYHFATGDAACQFACQHDARCRPSGSTATFYQSPGRCYGPFTHTVAFWQTSAPYWDYTAARGQHCKVPVRQTDSLTGPENCGYSIGDPRSDISWIQEYDWVGSGWICPLGNYNFNSADKTCTKLYATAYPPPSRSPKCGNPVLAGSGCKVETIHLTTLPAGDRRIPLELRYASLQPRGGGRLVGHQSWFLEPLDRHLTIPPNAAQVGSKVVAIRSHGGFEEFTRSASGSWSAIDARVSLRNYGAGWQLIDFDDNTVESYDSLGRLVQLSYFSGSALYLTYPSPTSTRPAQVTSSTGFAVGFTYAAAGVQTVLLPANRRIQIAYRLLTVPGMPAGEPYLDSITFEDETTRFLSYSLGLIGPGTLISIESVTDRITVHYVTTPPFGSGVSAPVVFDFAIGGRAPYALESVIDQLNNRSSRFEYDHLGRATLTEQAGGVNQYRFSYPNSQQTLVLEPLGATTTFTSSQPIGNGPTRITHVTRTAPNRPTAMFGGYVDPYGNITSRWQWHQTSHTNCFDHDTALGREIARVEALPYGISCPSNLAGYVPQAGTQQRKTVTEWNPYWRLPVRIAEPKKITTYVYNGQGATCAPSTVLVDGKPPAVVCSRTEQATTDETGAQGFAATVTGPARTWRWNYSTYGRVLTATDPNGKITLTSYYPDDDPDRGRRGNAASVTNAAGHVTQYTAYNPHGQVTQMIDPNGLVTDLTYDLRLRLTSRKVGNELTRFGYDPAGQLISVELPDGASLTYTYDAAQRLTEIRDHKGNRVIYILDAMGNRIGEQMADPGGVLVRNIARSIDALNRVQQVTGAVQ
jgi:YD repeat-containing protein